ncbi:hypothetical protein B0A50_00577 [Salinomyces thailandicus]|uniref:Uncharacterized protein n=1 Tax=Salinomyces thailandicus TaxID=706561 RepID=A0A4U0UDZ1_9PEZI|nr:hypothetical protein B0A50_00577 [Salinomyces thailandica]
MPPRFGFRPIRLVVLLALTLLAWSTVFAYRHKTRLHVLQPDLYRAQTLGPSQHLLLPERIGAFCRAHGFDEYRHPLRGDASNPPRERKVYDLFLLSTELKWLDIRLHTLSPYVDYFVIVESRTTFTGLPKPAYLADEYWATLPAAFQRKIIHRVVEDPGEAVGKRTWDHEDFMRNALFDHVFPDLIGTPEAPQDGDVILLSDVDEIPKPETLVVLRQCAFPDRLTLRSHFYYYSFQWLHSGPQWAHPQATTYHGITPGRTLSPQNLRSGDVASGFLSYPLNHLRAWWQTADLWDAAWHCSSCFATISEMQMKMTSFSHVPLNTAANRDPKRIVERVRKGEDLFGRAGEVFERIDDNRDVPNYILQNRREFGYLLDRDGEGAAFSDWEGLAA